MICTIRSWLVLHQIIAFITPEINIEQKLISDAEALVKLETIEFDVHEGKEAAFENVNIIPFSRPFTFAIFIPFFLPKGLLTG